ncbi:hypothetical protein BTE77_34865 [Ensifer adhaerens]|nr:hypothetical protein BTE77_34865 [Ensifer adhaerens]
MLKVLSRTYTATSVRNTLDYIGREGELEMETRDGPIQDSDDRAALTDEWVAYNRSFHADGRNGRASISTHMMLSMPAGTDRHAFKQSVRDFVKDEFDPRHDYALTFHDDTDHPHAHLVVLTRDDEGQALQIGRKNLDRWREQFAEKLRGNGVEADASPRHARGKFDKNLQRGDYHQRNKGRLSANLAKEARAVDQALREGRTPERPWDKVMRERREAIGVSYPAAAAELRQSTNAADRALGERVATFERNMPPARTRHQKIVAEVSA